MATTIAEQAVAGPYLPETALAADKMTVVTFTAGDATDGNRIVMSGRRTLLLITNGGASPATITIKSSPDPFGRVADITDFSVAAGAFAARIFEPVGWEQTLGGRDLDISVSAADIEILAIPL
jgi:hypothetical protein